MNTATEEQVQIVDRQNRPAGAAARSVMRRRALTHRACYILVFNREGDLFLQKRTMSKDIYPGYWDVAAGGVVLAGESYEASAARELAEELGISGVPLTLLFDHYYEDETNRVWGRIFSCRHDGPFILQAEEVAYGRFLSMDEALRLSLSEPFTPDGVEILLRIRDGGII
jgi:8-oxo-dGTP pyrophosphatase MutT (NUDIX family)